MLKIGDFSTLSQVSVKTLRYYDERGLLSAAHIDPITGYRYYSTAQISQLHRILALKDLGFSLDQIAKCLEEQVTAEQMRGMLLLREAEQQAKVEEERDRLSRLRSRIRLIELETRMSQEILLKEVPPQWVASVREMIPNYPSVGALYPRVAAALGPAMAESIVSFASWHDREYREKDVDAEAGFYLRKPVQVADGARVHELPAVNAASIVHSGSYQRLPEAYDALLLWVASNGYQVAGPIRELYLHMSMPVRQDDDSYVTEIQVPVSKA
jgi:DNA-binding transcriptional MerR regulator/effector-binding domain-containing protein